MNVREQAEFDQLRQEFMNDVSAETRGMYLALLREGFSKDEALALTQTYLVTVVTQAGEFDEPT